MKASNRIIVNTLAQYVRTIFNVVLSLWSSRLILLALGESDFGIYSLVAGIVSMLSFMVNALTQSTQRYISYYQGKNNIDDTKSVFNNSLILHLSIGLVLIVLFEIVSLFLFDGFLNISLERIEAAKVVYQLVAAMLFVSVVSAPFKALLISHENIIYVSIVEVVDGILKLILAISLAYINYDKLIVYGCLMLAISVFNLLSFLIYDLIKYKECKILDLRSFNLQYVKETFSFTGWVVYYSLCVVGRAQGIALVVNKFYGAVLNAAYGIGVQVSGAVNFVSSSLSNAVNPQLVKAEGANNRKQVWTLAILQCKYSFLLLAAVSIPIIWELDTILEIWLKEVPANTNFFATMILVATLINQLTYGLTSAKRAIGNIKVYELVTATPKLLAVLFAALCLYYGAPLYSIAICYVGAESFSAFIRLPLLKYTDGFDVKRYFKDVLLKCVIPVLFAILSCCLVIEFVDINFRFLLTFFVSVMMIMFSSYFFSMGETEKEKVKSVFKAVLKYLQSRVCKKS